jgi:hypothetical protein
MKEMVSILTRTSTTTSFTTSRDVNTLQQLEVVNNVLHHVTLFIIFRSGGAVQFLA